MDLMNPEKHIPELPQEDRQHYLHCPHCGNFFDMRDLMAVLLHQHQAEPLPKLEYSHAKKATLPMRFPRAAQGPN
jgi:hypothetical protein